MKTETKSPAGIRRELDWVGDLLFNGDICKEAVEVFGARWLELMDMDSAAAGFVVFKINGNREHPDTVEMQVAG